jgi:hypothetical protein
MNTPCALACFDTIDHETDCKPRSLSKLGLHQDISTKLFNDLFGNAEPQTDSLLVHLETILDANEILEKLTLVVFLDSYASILN